jgi:hypothetical protein
MADTVDMADEAGLGDDLLVLITEERVARERAPQPEPTTTLAVTVPFAVCEGLKEALSVLPGTDLDLLASVALRQVLWDLGIRDFPRRFRRRAEDPLIVLY